MDGLPFLPGFRFKDITKHDFNLCSQYRWKNGYAIPKDKPPGIGKDVDSVLYAKSLGSSGYNAELIYGKARDPPKQMVEPKFSLFGGKNLSFNGYTQIEIKPPAIDKYRVRSVKITYFLVDDTISVNEPVKENAGYAQGCLLKRGLIPNPNRKNRTWHWSDLNNGVELDFYGVKYQLCNCDLYTKNFLSIHGVTVKPDELVPDDPYMTARLNLLRRQYNLLTCANEPIEDNYKLKQFIKYDGIILRFNIVWYDFEPDEWKFYVLLYFMADDRVLIYQSKEKSHSGNLDIFPTFLGKIKLPKDWANLPSIFSSNSLEPKNKDFQKYYQPKDFIIGNSIFVMGRRFSVYDCDLFTRNYFKEHFKIDQPEPISISFGKDKDELTVKKKVIPPHLGIGDPEDTQQNCLALIPKPPKTLDFVTYVLNASKKLRYKLKMIPVYEVDKFRDFIMEFCLGNDHMNITELAGNNSGFTRCRFMAATRLRKPNTNIDDNDFYGTKDFFIGAKLYIKGSVFEIVELDLWTYNYMTKNMDKFTEEAFDGATSFLERQGSIHLKDEESSSITHT